MSKTNNLTDFLTDVASAIRTKKGYPATQKINPQNFSSEIDDIKTTPNLQQKTVSPSISSQSVTPDSGYDGLSKVTVNGAPLQEKTVIPVPGGSSVTPDTDYYGLSKVTITGYPLQSKTVTPSATPQTVTPSTGYRGLSSVTVNGDSDLVAENVKNGVEIFGVTGTYKGTLQSKTVTPSTSSQTVTPDENVGFTGLSQVTVNAAKLQSKTVTPSASQQTVTPNKSPITALDFYGLSSVTVNGDANLIAGNIKKGTSIFGVTGTYEGSGGVITKYLSDRDAEMIFNEAEDAVSITRVYVSDIFSHTAQFLLFLQEMGDEEAIDAEIDAEFLIVTWKYNGSSGTIVIKTTTDEIVFETYESYSATIYIVDAELTIKIAKIPIGI